MTTYKGYYSVIQYCPDKTKLEVANMGVLLFCPELKFIDARLLNSNQKIRRFFGSGAFDNERLNFVKESIRTRVSLDKNRFNDLEDLMKFVQTRANEVQLSEPRPIKVENPEKDLDQLFNEITGGLKDEDEEVGKPGKINEIKELFRKPQLIKRVQFDKKIKLPILGREEIFPIAYNNGDLNLIKPEIFRNTPQSIQKAERIACEGKIIEKHILEDERNGKLIVISLFDEQEKDHGSVEEIVRGIFHDLKIESYVKRDMPKLIAHVDKTAH